MNPAIPGALALLTLHSAHAAQLPELLITAERIAETADETLASVTLIERKQIEAWQVSTLPELLRRLPGVNFSQSGGAGQPASLYLRGTNFNHTLVLIDGIRIGSASLGSAALYQLPISAVERIEIVRGPRSGLYGSEAIGGVIQIFTASQAQGTHRQLKLSGGADNSWGVEARQHGAQGATRYSLSASHQRSDGTNACLGGFSGGCFTDEPDEDGHRASSLSLNLSHAVNKDLRLGLHGLRAQGRTAYDSSFQNEVDFVQQTLGLNADWQLARNWELRARLGESRDEADNFGHDQPHAVFDNQRRQASLQANAWFADTHSLSFGYEFLRDALDASTAYTENQRDNQAGFVRYGYHGERLNLSAAWRLDDNEQFGQHHTGQVALGYQFTPAWRGFASYASGFRAPTFNELYYPGFGNAELSPETSHSYELGLRFADKAWRFAAALFQTRIEDLIATVYNPANGSYLPQNIHQADIRGVELSARWQARNWTLEAQYTGLDGEDADSGKQLPRRARHGGSLDLSYQGERFNLGGQLLAQGQRYEDAANTRALSGYAVLNLRAAYDLNRNWQVQFKLDNALGRDYETAYRYAMPGRRWLLSVLWRAS